MKKYIVFVAFPFLLASCAILSGKFNKSAYRKADKIVYEEIFENKKVEITDKAVIFQIVEIFGESKKEPANFVAKEQLLFIRAKDTLVLYKNNAGFQDARGSYVISDEAEQRLMKLLSK